MTMQRMSHRNTLPSGKQRGTPKASAARRTSSLPVGDAIALAQRTQRVKPEAVFRWSSAELPMRKSTVHAYVLSITQVLADQNVSARASSNPQASSAVCTVSNSWAKV